MRNPYISVIIPAYNEEELIKKCLDSLLNQDLNRKEFEIIIIDNGSTDKTSKIVKKYPFRLIYEPKKSVTRARQKGVINAKGEIIVSADADTFYPPNWLSQIKKNFNQDKKIIAVVGWIFYIDTKAIFNILNGFNQEINLYLSKKTGKFPIAYAANMAFKKSALIKIGGYPEYLTELGDQQHLLYNFFRIGKVVVDQNLKCYTSARKLKDLGKNIFIYNGWHRIIGYLVNGITKREIIKAVPAIRSGN